MRHRHNQRYWRYEPYYKTEYRAEKNHDVMPRDEIQRKGHNSCKEKTDRKKIIIKDVPA